jgi:hypothetical protein
MPFANARTPRGSRTLVAAVALILFLLATQGCSGGGGGGDQSFQIVAVNLPKNTVGWEINRAIRITFNQPIDASSVSNNTVQVRLVGGSPAFGTPSIDPSDPHTVMWRPLCPVDDDLTKAGLQSGFTPSGAAYLYELNVLGADKNAGFTIRSTSGRALELSETRTFTTPTSQEFSKLFVDEVVGPPIPIVRLAGDVDPNATHVVVAGAKHYFERQPGSVSVRLEPPLELPLNLLSDPDAQVELLVHFNQSVDMRSENIDPARIRWEFQTAPDVYRALTTELSLLSNCTETGAVLRIRPLGLLPPTVTQQGDFMRVVVTPLFKDLVGEKNQLPKDMFATADTVQPPIPLVDHYLEEFLDDRNQDESAPFAEPTAEWGGGAVQAKFSFAGNGGFDGDFDLKIATGEVLLFNTVNATLTGGPGFVPQTVQLASGGLIDVRDLWIEAGGVLKCEGPNPVTILASGDVRIDGKLDVSGTNSPGVNSLNTTTVPEPGGPGQCGGGKGGTGSRLVTTSTPRGGNGFGAYNTADAGGQGGDTGWSNGGGTNARRGAGGGGGRLGQNVPDVNGQAGVFNQFRIGMDGEDGFANSQATNGVSSGAGPALGGLLGPSPFVDGDPSNDFFGTMFDALNGRLIVGELKQPWAGAGGGAGGDAARVKNGEVFPQSKFNPKGDEKGAGGGGGGGSLQILALGSIELGAGGKIFCRGGTGGGGENSSGTNRVGGGSGGGAGGHVILQSATKIDLSQVASGTPGALGVAAIIATGGQGGAGILDSGGAFLAVSGLKETVPQLDACPALQASNASTNGTSVPCLGPIDGCGGDGGPGLIQLHTSTGVVGLPGSGADILLAPGATLGEVCAPPPLCAAGAGACYMVPTFGRTSRTRSDWIALGEGGFDNSAAVSMQKPVLFDFQGTDASGAVMADLAGNVTGLAPVLSASSVLASGRTFTLDASPLIGGPDEVLVRQPLLLRHFLLELRDSTAPTTSFMRFDVVSASFDAGTNALLLQLDANGPPLESFQAAAPIDAVLQPAFFRIRTDGVNDVLPASASVRVLFEATEADTLGRPIEPPVVPLTADVADLNAYAGSATGDNSSLRFMRFELLFDIDVLQQGLTPTNPIPAATHLRMPFRYP